VLALFRSMTWPSAAARRSALSRPAAVLVALLALGSVAQASPISVSYTVTGSPGAWILDFTVTNNLSAWPMQALYGFGVESNQRDILGSPASFDPNLVTSWNNSAKGGSSITYNNVWDDDQFMTSYLFPGSTLSGFVVEDTVLTAPTSIDWFAYTYDVSGGFDPYTGGGNFNTGNNPGFEGVALDPIVQQNGSDPAPEPSSLALLGAGMLALIALRRRRRLGSF